MSRENQKPNLNPADIKDLDGFLKFFKQIVLLDLFVSLPAVIEEYNRESHQATVIPAIPMVGTDTKTLNKTSLYNIPVRNTGGGGFAANFPLKKGDTGWLIICDRDISIFKSSREVSPPNTYRKHNLADAFFLPDAMQTVEVSEEDAGRAVWQKLDGSVKISLGESDIKITAPDGVYSSKDMDIDGDLKTSGDIMAEGKITATGEISSAVDVKAGEISLKAHIHGGVSGGQGTTGPAQ